MTLQLDATTKDELAVGRLDCITQSQTQRGDNKNNIATLSDCVDARCHLARLLRQ